MLRIKETKNFEIPVVVIYSLQQYHEELLRGLGSVYDGWFATNHNLLFGTTAWAEISLAVLKIFVEYRKLCSVGGREPEMVEVCLTKTNLSDPVVEGSDQQGVVQFGDPLCKGWDEVEKYLAEYAKAYEAMRKVLNEASLKKIMEDERRIRNFLDNKWQEVHDGPEWQAEIKRIGWSGYYPTPEFLSTLLRCSLSAAKNALRIRGMWNI